MYYPTRPLGLALNFTPFYQLYSSSITFSHSLLIMQKMYEKPVLQENLSSPKSSSSISTEDLSHDLPPIDRAAEKRLVWKCDLHVLPMISLLYMLAFIDRINIGNARIQGLETDLHMKGNDYNIALFVFFISYILFEVPSNILIKRIAPSTWLSFIMLCWGMIDAPVTHIS